MSNIYPEKQEQINEIWEIVGEIKKRFEQISDEEFVRVKLSEATEDDPTAMIFLDIYHYTTFNVVENKLFRQAIAKCDAMNFFILNNEWIRITFGVFDACDPKKSDTKILPLKKQ